jgi:threonine 3-dehydrogenase
VQRELGMKEGFDVGLEMSGSPKALGDMIDNMCHGGRIALLGIMPEKAAIDWNKVVFNMLTIRGIYGREMYETWYKMTALIQAGLDITPVITHRLPFTDFQNGFDLMRSGRSGKIVLSWD